jgi:hypothetical protein
MEAGATSQGMWTSSRNQQIQENGLSSTTSRSIAADASRLLTYRIGNLSLKAIKFVSICYNSLLLVNFLELAYPVNDIFDLFSFLSTSHSINLVYLCICEVFFLAQWIQRIYVLSKSNLSVQTINHSRHYK